MDEADHSSTQPRPVVADDGEYLAVERAGAPQFCHDRLGDLIE